jgi:membrane-associated protease RseP (regulator of RpoE activity)
LSPSSDEKAKYITQIHKSSLRRSEVVEGDFGAYYKNYSFVILGPAFTLIDVTLHAHDYSYAGGPRVNFRPLFVHALFGGDHLAENSIGSQNAFALALGGGLEWKVASHWAVRGSGDYVRTRHNIFGGPPFTQNNFRASAGIVYMFGGGMSEGRDRHDRDHRDMNRQVETATPCDSKSEAALLGVVGCGSEGGLKVTTVRPGSPAAQVGITPGDIVTMIDGRPVQNSRDIELAIAASTTGIVKITYSIKGNWATVREVKVR